MYFGPLRTLLRTPAVTAAAGGITFEDAGIVGNATNGTTSTFSAKAIGAAATGRLLVICVAGNAAGASPGLSGLTVDGNAATLVGSAGLSTDFAIGIFKYALDAGTTANIVASWNAITVGRAHCAVFALYGANHTQTDNEAQALALGTTITSTIDVPTGGIAFGFECHGNTASNAWTGTGTTQATASVISETACMSSAYNQTVGAGQSMISTWAGSAHRSAAAVAFGP